MLAYVFWHWPAAGVPTDEYEDLQRAFHAALARSRPPGFRYSIPFRLSGDAPWLGGSPAYADWYVLDDSAAMDALNAAAVSGACQAPHEQVARAAQAGAGSLLTLRSGPGDVAAARISRWLAKPRGMTYDTFDAEVDRALDAQGASVWRRQMVLGPSPEFAILGAAPISVPSGFESLELRLTPLASAT